ncbi:CPBP family intramembrane metalloprotease [Mergibacter septicus]|nr:CPBP family intramembrane metalloprotease [Mergibacter septicus]
MFLWSLLALSLILLSVKRVSLGIFILYSVIFGAIYQGILEISTLFFILFISCLLYLYKNKHWKWLEGILVIFCFLLYFHHIAGFNNPMILSQVKVSENSANFNLYYNLDKALIPFILFPLIPNLFSCEPKITASKIKWGVLILSPSLLLMLASLVGSLKVEFHIPTWLPYFILSNLFFVSLVEESLFRGYLQQRLQAKIGSYPAVFVSAIIFALSHYGYTNGNIFFMLFIGLAGIIYSLAWLWSGKVWVSTFIHFGLNLTHLLFFTYPYLVR